MKTIEPILSCLTSITMVDDLRQVLREKDPEFLPAEEKFLEAVAHLTEKLGIEEVERYVTAMEADLFGPGLCWLPGLPGQLTELP